MCNESLNSNRPMVRKAKRSRAKAAILLATAVLGVAAVSPAWSADKGQPGKNVKDPAVAASAAKEQQSRKEGQASGKDSAASYDKSARDAGTPVPKRQSAATKVDPSAAAEPVINPKVCVTQKQWESFVKRHAEKFKDNKLPAHAHFRVTVLSFKCWSETLDDFLDADGYKDEVFLRYTTVVADGDGNQVMSATDRTKIMGDIGGDDRRREWSGLRVQAGRASAHGGVRSGDSYPSENPAGIATPPTYLDRLPTVVFDGRLMESEHGVAIIPELWEYDGPNDLLISSARALEESINGILQSITAFAAGPEAANIVGDGLSIGLPALIAGGPGDRPIGIERRRVPVNGRQEMREVFIPKAIRLNYATANRLSQENLFGRGRGVIPLEYRDHAGLHGDYTLYVKVERIDDAPMAPAP